MNKIMKTLALAATFCGLGITSTALADGEANAATPVAVWDGDFSKTISGYTLNLNGNSVDNGVITINQSKGVTVDWTTAMYDTGMTVLFKYSNLTLDAQKTIATSCINSDKTGDRTGVYLHYNNTPGNPDGIWATTSRYDTEASRTTMTSSQLSGTFAFTYKGGIGNGTYLYRIANGVRTTVFGCAKLNSYEDHNIYGCAVGGTRAASTFAAATGMKISAIAVFNSVLSEDEMANYLFPSEQTKENAYLWLDASQGDTIETDGSGNVTKWTSRSSSGKAATSYSAGGVSKGPTVTSKALAGMDVVDFGSVGSGMDLKFDAVNNIRAVFMVTAIDDSPKAFILGGEGNYYNFHRGEQSSNVQFFSGNASEYLRNGVIRRDRVAKTSTTAIGTGYGLITLIPTAGVNASRICQDRSESGRNGGKKIAELIIFTCEISETARNNIETYLMNKWFPTYEATVSQSCTWTELWGENLPPSGVKVKIVRSGDATDATLTIDSAVTLDKVTVTSESGKNLNLVLDSGKTFAATAYDFSGANGKVTFGFSTGTAAVTAGKDTVLPSSGTGALTVGANSKVTVLDGSWSGTKTLASTSELCYGGTMPASLPYTEGNPADGVIVGYAGTHTASGTIGFSNNLTTRRIEAGANIKASVLQLGNSNNAVETFEQTGGVIEATSNGAGTSTDNAAIIIAHYGWNAPSQITYNLLGGSMVATNATLYGVYFGADGKATMTIGGGSTEAVLDTTGIAQGNQDRTKASALTIAENGTLKLGTGGLYFRNVNATVTLSGGTVYAKDTCSLSVAKTDGIVLAASKDSKLSAVNGKTLTVSSKVSGSGSLTKTGAGSVVLSGNNTFTGGTTISEGVLVLGSDSALSGTVTLTANGQLDLYGHSATVTIAGSGTVCNSSETTAHINGIPVGAGKELTFTEGKTSIIVPEGETLTLTALPPNGTVTIGGAGKVAFTTTAEAPAYPTWTWIADGDDAWTGTYALTGFTTATAAACGNNGWDLRPYYNGTKSVFEVVGSSASATVTGYFLNQSFSVGELVLSGAVKIENGYSNYTYSFTKISGSKAFTINTGTTTITATVKFADISAFTGTLSVSSPKNSDNKCYCVIVGNGTLPSGYTSDMSSIYFTGDTTLNMVTLSASNGIKVNGDAVVTVLASKMPTCNSGTMTFENGSSIVLEDANANTKLIANGGISVASGVTIPVAIANTAGLVADKVCITWPSKPDGAFELLTGSGAAKGTSGFQASKNSANLTAVADTSKTYYEVDGGKKTTTFDNTWLTSAGISGSTTEVQTALDKANANGVKPSNAYLMGYDADKVTSAAIVPMPLQTSDATKVRLSVTGVPEATARRNGATVTYTVTSSTSRDMSDPSETKEIGDATTVDMTVPSSGVLYYRIQANVALP